VTIANLKPYPKGVSGNPSGRPKGIAAIARAHKDKAVQVLVEAMDDDDARVRVTAAKEILDRGFGKSITMSADVTDRLDDMDEEAIDAALNALRDVISARSEASETAGDATAH